MGNRKRTNIFVRIAVIFVIVFFVVSIVQMQVKLSELKEQKNLVESEINKISDDIDEINLRLETPLTDEYIKRVAREKLGYCDEDEIIFYNDLTD
ncbi:MAG: hypothetical protein A2Y17_00310 [Clostridiales bacterium GWF2_38_85]|nr:MAG: hypothetical protein A2Y17_00310 [Clostridiales bacterium GWF2_38_85]HBL83903.1 hypothetical protein [Clostridiales bacterium]